MIGFFRKIRKKLVDDNKPMNEENLIISHPGHTHEQRDALTVFFNVR